MYPYKKGREWKKWKEIFRLPNLYIWTKAYCSRKQSVKTYLSWATEMHSTTQKDEGKNTHTHTHKEKNKSSNKKMKNTKLEKPPHLHCTNPEDQEKDTLINETLLTRIINIQVV